MEENAHKNNKELKVPIGSLMIQLFFIAFILYMLFLAGMYLMQRNFIYMPSGEMKTPTAHGLADFEQLLLTTRDGLSITSWYKAPRKNFPLVIYFHGNAGHLGDRAERLKKLSYKGFGVLAISYRGYGTSPGKPTEPGLYEDALTATEYATDQLKISPEKIILFGESLGSGVAVNTAANNIFELGMVVLEAPYMSVADRAAEIYPYIPAKFLVKDRFDSMKKISRINAPLLIFHARDDDVIPYHHGKNLFVQAEKPKTFVTLNKGEHVNYENNDIINIIFKHAAKYGLINAATSGVPKSELDKIIDEYFFILK